ncbi:hypothetical protein [Streptomyces sp. NPDC047071]|uniref:hypothetical protein n=1 Tax=Streptomyces sp. NPDC047071 TaxID=3154808 RepID=UPI003451AB7B
MASSGYNQAHASHQAGVPEHRVDPSTAEAVERQTDRHAAAARTAASDMPLRSSVAPESDRHQCHRLYPGDDYMLRSAFARHTAGRADECGPVDLRSSVTSKGDHHHDRGGLLGEQSVVAILSHPGGRLPPGRRAAPGERR